jgi:hypothetical protein
MWHLISVIPSSSQCFHWHQTLRSTKWPKMSKGSNRHRLQRWDLPLPNPTPVWLWTCFLTWQSFTIFICKRKTNSNPTHIPPQLDLLNASLLALPSCLNANSGCNTRVHGSNAGNLSV